MTPNLTRKSYLTLLGLFLLSSFLFLAHPASADSTESMTVVQAFGVDDSYYKIMVKAKSGNRFFVWYYYALNVDIGGTVIITFDNYGDWKTITNPANGKEQDIHKVLKVN
jgi:hypothetical protein